MIAQVLADWTLIGLVVMAVLAVASLWCGLTGRLPSWYLLRRTSLPPDFEEQCKARAQVRADLMRSFRDAQSAERRRLDGARHTLTGANTVIWETDEERDRQRLDAAVQIGDRRRP